MRTIPLTRHHGEHDLFAWFEQQRISHAQFIDHVHQVAAQLHDKPFVINLVENRYLFILTFAAALLRRQVSLLPPSRTPADVNRVIQNYPDCYCLADQALELDTPTPRCQVKIPSQHLGHTSVPDIGENQLAAITFTSGSTGTPQPHTKYWGDLAYATDAAAQRFGLYDKTHRIIATVPPQHMYGFETSVLYPLLTGCAIYGGRPFYPADINHAVNTCDQPVLLITTPVHLRACTAAGLEWKHIELIISATAPLDRTLARQAQETMHAPVKEIFGCTEAGSIASRETLATDTWRMYPEFTLRQDKSGIQVVAAHLREPVTLHDNIELLNEHEFIHLGRSGDMINIAGKRGSLSDLNLKLQELEMVEAGAFFLPEDEGRQQTLTRLTAFVVAPEADEKEILSALSQKVDPVFLPRPLYKVNRLPYNETGKLTLRALRELHLKLRNGERR